MCIAKAKDWAQNHEAHDLGMLTSEIRRLQLMKDSFLGLNEYYQNETLAGAEVRSHLTFNVHCTYNFTAMGT